MDGVSGTCDEVCDKKRGGGWRGDTWWWNEEVKETMTRNTDGHKAICRNSTEENRIRCKYMKNKAKTE